MFVDRKAELSHPLGAFEAERLPSWRVEVGPKLSVSSLLNGDVPRPFTFDAMSRDIYTALSLAPVSLFSASSSDSRQSVLVGPPMTGDTILHLLTYPSKFDTLPVTPAIFFEHWNVLEGSKELLKTHKTMPGWDVFLSEGGQIRDLVAEYYPNPALPSGSQEHDFLYPTLRWETKEDGSRKILLNSPDRGLLSSLQQEVESDPRRLDRFNSLIGLVFLATFSSEQTNWPYYDGYAKETSRVTQDMGGVQMMGFIAREVARAQKKGSHVVPERDIQQSPLLAAIDEQLLSLRGAK